MKWYKFLKKLYHKKSNDKSNDESPITKYDTNNKLDFVSNNQLIVDDSEINRRVLKNFLIRKKINIIEANNGKEAIEIVNKINIDIIWADIQMPIINGIEMTQILRNTYKYHGIIVGITGHVDNISRQQCNEAGMNLIIPKPINSKDIYYYVEKFTK